MNIAENNWDDLNTEKEDPNNNEQMPDRMPKIELEWEVKERISRKKNIMVWGFRTSGKHVISEVKQTIYEMTEVWLNIASWRAIGGGLLLTLNSMHDKKWIMSKKRLLRGTSIIVSDDLTEKEKQVQNWIKFTVNEAKQKRLNTRIGYLKWQMNNQWCYWCEEEGRPKQTFRGYGK